MFRQVRPEGPSGTSFGNVLAFEKVMTSGIRELQARYYEPVQDVE